MLKVALYITENEKFEMPNAPAGRKRQETGWTAPPGTEGNDLNLFYYIEQVFET